MSSETDKTIAKWAALAAPAFILPWIGWVPLAVYLTCKAAQPVAHAFGRGIGAAKESAGRRRAESDQKVKAAADRRRIESLPRPKTRDEQLREIQDTYEADVKRISALPID